MDTKPPLSRGSVGSLVLGLGWLAGIAGVICAILLGSPSVEDYIWLVLLGVILGPIVLALIVRARLSRSPTNSSVQRGSWLGLLGCICIALAACGGLFLLPAADMLRKGADKMYNAKNFKQIGIAMHHYATEHGHLPPPASTAANGKPLLSWRVLILPFMEKHDLYGQFHLDEPWDSPHNLRLLPEMPLIYQHPVRRYRESEKTPYQLIVGGGAAIDWGRTTTYSELGAGDGNGNTIFLVDAFEQVPWTKPADIDYDPSKPLPRFHVIEGSIILGLGDGSCLSVPAPDTAERERLFRAWITWNGGEKVPGPGWD